MKVHFLLSLLLATFAFNSAARAAREKSICEILDDAILYGSPSARLQKYLTEQWKYQMHESPESATYLGYPGQDDRLTDMSMAAIQRREKEKKCQLMSLSKIHRDTLKGEERVTYDLAKSQLDLDVEGNKFDGKYLVLDHLSGIHIDLPDLMFNAPKNSVKDYENRIARLSKVPKYVDQIKILMAEGLKKKVTPVKMFLAHVPAEFDKVLTEKVEDSPLYAPFKEFKSEIPEADQKRLQAKAKEILQNETYPALKQLKEFVVKTYIPGARESTSWADMPKGKDWYAYLVKMHTTTNKSPAELHELGLKEVARITAEMEKLKEEAKFKGDLKAFNQFLLTDDQFYYTKPNDLIAGYTAITKKIDTEVPHLFKHLPKLSYGVREMPAYKAANAPTAYYEGGSLETGRPGYFEANTYDLKARPKWGMEALTSHEAVPGHHLQIALAQEIQGLPEFRKNGGYTAFVEGWGLYAETLGSDLGLYKDVYSKYGQATYEMFRAVRLVVDTGMHSMGWSRDKALQYCKDNMAKSQTEIEAEVDRYITWPGQALAYKVGQLKFQELRDRAKQTLGSKFDIRDFHDEVLRHGALPMDVLDKVFAEWLTEQSKVSQAKALSLDKGEKADKTTN